MGPDHDHDHAHLHGPAAPGGDQALTSRATQRAMLGAVAVLALVAAVGLVALWPRGERPPIGVDFAFGAERVDATVTGLDVVPCLGTSAEDRILCQDVLLEVTSGVDAGRTGSFQLPIDATAVDLGSGDRIVVEYRPDAPEDFQFRFLDFQRSTPLVVLALAFVAAVLLLGRWQGVRALAGLLVTGVVVVGFLFPALLHGRSPIAAALVTAIVIALVALYLTHGVSERTTVALLGALGALALTAALAAAFSTAASITGFASEDAAFLQVAAAQVDVRGLVLAGIIIGSLGVLDDVTITQASAVWQLHRANPSYGLRELYDSAVTIGRDHIASAVNTLVLAYAGAALPLLLLFTQADRPLSEVALGEEVAVEIIRTLVGSIGLIAAVPLTTLLAAVVITRGTGPALAAPDAASGPLAPRRQTSTEPAEQPSPWPPPPPGEPAPLPPPTSEDPGQLPEDRGEGEHEAEHQGQHGDEPGWDDFAPPPEPDRW